MTEAARKIPRSMMRSWAARHLKIEQGGLCPLCGFEIDLRIKGEGVIDHDHDTGRIRGVLHRSCNAAEGKATNAIGQWGAKSTKYPDILRFMRNLLEYLEKEPTNFIYAMHKTEDEKREARNAKARKARSVASARRELLKRKES